MSGTVIVRPELSSEVAAIHGVEAAAFGRESEAILVDALRELQDGFVSLVAEDHNEIVGHICFSRVHIDGCDGLFLALAPMGVLPTHQRRGIGSKLIYAGLDECRTLKVNAVFVVGHPAFYSRFGFSPASELSVRCEFDVPDEAFRLIEASAGMVRPGMLRYPVPFHALGA